MLWTVVGLLLLGYGYYLAITSEINSNIFGNFFLAVFLVVLGTHFLFTCGSITFLRVQKRRKRYYYRSDNFVAVSGMIYRMKKNAASLVNICIFGMMVIITLVCTVSLYLGIPGMHEFKYPNDISAQFMTSSFTTREKWEEDVKLLARKEGISLAEYNGYENILLSIVIKGKHILAEDETASYADPLSDVFPNTSYLRGIREYYL